MSHTLAQVNQTHLLLARWRSEAVDIAIARHRHKDTLVKLAFTFLPGWQPYDRGGRIGPTLIHPELRLELIAQPERIERRTSLAPRFQLWTVDEDGELSERLIATEQFDEVLAAVERRRAARVLQAAE